MMDLDFTRKEREVLAALTADEQSEVNKILAERSLYMRTNRIERYKPYAWQKRLHAGGIQNSERMARAANRTGKTFSAACEVSYHATGEYPDWWEGKRFDKQKSLVIWVGSKTNKSSRDIVQAALLGDVEHGDEIGTGTIPRRCIKGKPKTANVGLANVVDHFWVKRKNGGRCKIQFLTYEMGWQKWQGTRVHFVWLDEEPARGEYPTDEDYKVYTEAQTRVADNEGCVLITFTPLSGYTKVVEHFDEHIPGTAVYEATWADAPHLSDERKAQLIASYPAHEVEARTKGVPMVGSGRVWVHSEDSFKMAPIELPRWWPRICGIDFGMDHPQAAVWMAWDRDADVVYVYDGYKEGGQGIAYHASTIKRRGAWIPVAWPHDGEQKDKRRPESKIADLYREEGVRMLQFSARYDIKTGGPQPQEPIVLDMDTRIREGRLRVFSTLEDWFTEYRNFHRKEGRIVNRKDDMLKATMYGLMMIGLGFATTEPRPHVRHRSRRPIVTSRAA